MESSNKTDTKGLSDEGEMMLMSGGDRFVWVNHFNERSLLDFYRKFTALENDPSIGVIPIIIDSDGGNVTALMGMLSLIRNSRKQVLTLSISKAKSCGLSLLAAGTKGMRFMTQTATAMLHDAAYMAGYDKVHDQLNTAASINKVRQKMFDELGKDTGHTAEFLLDLLKKNGNVDMHMDAAEAKAMGFIDHIGMPTIVVDQPQWAIGIKAPMEQAPVIGEKTKKPSKRVKNGKSKRS